MNVADDGADSAEAEVERRDRRRSHEPTRFIKSGPSFAIGIGTNRKTSEDVQRWRRQFAERLAASVALTSTSDQDCTESSG